MTAATMMTRMIRSRMPPDIPLDFGCDESIAVQVNRGR